MAKLAVATPDDLAAVSGAAMRAAWTERDLAEARVQDAIRERDRATARVREAEFAYERACRG